MDKVAENKETSGDAPDRWSRLTAERDEARKKAEQAWKDIDSLESQLQSAQKKYEQLNAELQRVYRNYSARGEKFRKLEQEQDECRCVMVGAHGREQKLIEGLRWYETASDYELSCDGGQRARIILKEIGVTVNE